MVAHDGEGEDARLPPYLAFRQKWHRLGRANPLQRVYGHFEFMADLLGDIA